MPQQQSHRTSLRDARTEAEAGNGKDTTAAGKQVATGDRYRQQLERMKGEFAKQLPGSGLITSDAFVRQALTGMKASAQAPQLLRILMSPQYSPSMFTALMTAARGGLMPFTEEGVIVPFGNVATFIPMWRGLVKQFYNSGQVSNVAVNLIAERDEWAEDYGSEQRFEHHPTRWAAKANGKPDYSKPLLRGNDEAERRGGIDYPANPYILAYCYVRLTNGGEVWAILDKLEAE